MNRFIIIILFVIIFNRQLSSQSDSIIIYPNGEIHNIGKIVKNNENEKTKLYYTKSGKPFLRIEFPDYLTFSSDKNLRLKFYSYDTIKNADLTEFYGYLRNDTIILDGSYLYLKFNKIIYVANFEENNQVGQELTFNFPSINKIRNTYSGNLKKDLVINFELNKVKTVINEIDRNSVFITFFHNNWKN